MTAEMLDLLIEFINERVYEETRDPEGECGRRSDELLERLKAMTTASMIASAPTGAGSTAARWTQRGMDELMRRTEP